MRFAMGLFKKRKDHTPEDGQMELVEHLAELRSRILRTILYVFAGMVVTYNAFPLIYRILFAPAYMVLDKLKQPPYEIDARPVFSGIQDAFLLRLETSLFAGLVLALPMIVWEIWGFIRPALTEQERQPIRYLAPFAALLLMAGLGTGYGALPTAYGWMAQYISDIQGATLLQNAKDYLLLTVKILAAFGIAFQLPVILLFLARVGILNSQIMTTYWRHAVVLIATAAAIFVPTNDPATMLLMAIPMAGLYLVSIVLVRAFEPNPDGTPKNDFLPKFLVALVPIALLSGVSVWLWISNPPKRAAAVMPNMGDAGIAVRRLEDRLAKVEKQATPSPDPSLPETLKRLEERVVALEKRLAEQEKKTAEQGKQPAAPAPTPLGRP